MQKLGVMPWQKGKGVSVCSMMTRQADDVLLASHSTEPDDSAQLAATGRLLSSSAGAQNVTADLAGPAHVIVTPGPTAEGLASSPFTDTIS